MGRVWFMVGCMTLEAAALLVLAGIGVEAWEVVVAGAAVGYAFGGLWAVFPTLVSLLFGLRNFGQNWGWLVIGSATGGMAFGMTASRIYDAQGKWISGPDGARLLRCYGARCYSWAFLLFSCLLLAAVLAFCLLFRFSRFGQRMRHTDDDHHHNTQSNHKSERKRHGKQVEGQEANGEWNALGSPADDDEIDVPTPTRT